MCVTGPDRDRQHLRSHVHFMKWTEDQYRVRRATGKEFTYAVHVIDMELDGQERTAAMLKRRPLPFPASCETISRICLNHEAAMFAADGDDAYARAIAKK